MCIPADIQSLPRLGRCRLWRKKRQDDLGEIWNVYHETVSPDWWPVMILRRFNPEVLHSERVLEALRNEAPMVEAFNHSFVVLFFDFPNQGEGGN